MKLRDIDAYDRWEEMGYKFGKVSVVIALGANLSNHNPIL